MYRCAQITMKYPVQLVDYRHKQIEDAMQIAEFYSPISFIKVNVNRKKLLTVLQLLKIDFKDFMSCSKLPTEPT